MSLKKIFDACSYWYTTAEPALELIAALTPADDAEVIGMLDRYAGLCPLEGPLADGVYWLPVGNSIHPCGSEAYMQVAFIVGKRATPKGIAALARIYREHASREVRLVTGHDLLLSPGHAELVAEGANALAREHAGWMGLWCKALLQHSKATAYEPIADLIASTNATQLRLRAAFEAAIVANVEDPRWAELAGMAYDSGDTGAIALLAHLGDRRAISYYAARLSSPDRGTVSDAIYHLIQIVKGDELMDLIREPYERASDPGMYEHALTAHGHPVGKVLAERRRDRRMAALAAKQYPYLFFGAAPADWYEGANGGHLYILRFASILDDAAWVKLDAVNAKQKYAGPWRFAELDGATWVMLFRGGKPLSPTNKVLPAIHKAAPLREVIFGGVRERDDDHDDWSFWSQNTPGASPRAPKLEGVDMRLVNYLRNRDIVDVTWHLRSQ